MPRNCVPAITGCLVLATSLLPLLAQDTAPHPPPYRGVNMMMAGVFVTPVADEPFSAVVKLENTQPLPDGTSIVRKSIGTIARDSRGRIYSERRQLLPSSFTGVPQTLSSLIFDPETRLSTTLSPYSHLGRQRTLPAPRVVSGAPPATRAPIDSPLLQHEDLGSDIMENVPVHGTRQTRTIPASVTGTGKDIVVIDEYWYSDELHMNMLTKRSDPRTGVQVVTITQVNRNEPDPALFQVPVGYKVVDETPPN